MSKAFNEQKSISKSVSVEVNASNNVAFDYISSSKELPNWLKKVGPIPGCESVEELDKSYDFEGAKRIVHFQGGDSAQEELVSISYPSCYQYQVSEFTNFLNKISGLAQSKIAFHSSNNGTRIEWDYSFQYKSLWGRLVLFLFMTLVYKRFMKKSLYLAKVKIEGDSNTI